MPFSAWVVQKAVDLVVENYMERLNFAALAEHCRARGSENPPAWNVRKASSLAEES